MKSMIHILHSLTETKEKSRFFITIITKTFLLGQIIFWVSTTLQIPESLDFIWNIINFIVGNIKFLKRMQEK